VDENTLNSQLFSIFKRKWKLRTFSVGTF
jgi:hypothetical protein